jgi:diacylglycerol kinase (ATP)
VSDPFGPLIAIVEPGAGAGGAGDQVPELERALKELDLTFSVRRAERPEQLEGLARTALEDGGRFLVAVGDDRTLQGVVNGMFRDDRPIVEGAILGMVPAGTRSDFMMTFGLPQDVQGACSHLAGTTTYPLDLMKVSCVGPGGTRATRYAANLAEAGMGGEMSRRSGREPVSDRRRFGAFWGAFARSRPRRMRVDADGRGWEGRAFNVVVGNGQFSAGGLRLSPRSFPGDGVLEGLVFTGPRSDAYRMLPRVFRHGDHVPDPHITELRAKIRLAVEGERPLPVAADGAHLGTTPATFQLVPHQIELKL